MKMENLEKLLHQRIINKCKSSYMRSDFSLAATRAIREVELVLREKTGDRKNLFESRLMDHSLPSKKNARLRLTHGDALKEKAKVLFESAFSYYRDFTAYEENNIDENTCKRIMVIASELLDLMGTPSVSLSEIGGLRGLIQRGIFTDESQLSDFLSLLSSQVFPYESFNGMSEEFKKRGFTEQQYQTALDLGLVEYRSEIIDHASAGEPADWDKFGWLELTNEARKILAQIQCPSSALI